MDDSISVESVISKLTARLGDYCIDVYKQLREEGKLDNASTELEALEKIAPLSAEQRHDIFRYRLKIAMDMLLLFQIKDIFAQCSDKHEATKLAVELYMHVSGEDRSQSSVVILNIRRNCGI